MYGRTDQLLSQRIAERRNRMHDNGIRSKAGERFSAHDRGHVHNRAGTLRAHYRHNVLGHAKHAEQTGIQGGLHIPFEALLRHRANPADAGVVDEDINTAKASHRARNKGRDGGGGRNVRGNGVDFGAECLHLAADRGEGLGCPGSKHEPGATLRVGKRNLAPDAA